MPPVGLRRLIVALSLLLAAMSWVAPLARHTPMVVSTSTPDGRPSLPPDPMLDARPPDVALVLQPDALQPAPLAADVVPDPQPTPLETPAAQPRRVLQVPYRIELRSRDPAVADARQIIPAVLEHPRGWQQAAIDFVADPNAPFTIVLAEGTEAQALCQPYDVGGQFSCQNGTLVVLNAIRWRDGVDHWPGDLQSYRTMLINHEVGHLLGMHHMRCAEPGAIAPVMEQQSGTLRGCRANSWPTSIELRLAATHQFTLAPERVDVGFPP